MKNTAALAILCISLVTTHNSFTAEPELLGRWSFGPVYAVVEQNGHIFFSSGGVIRIVAVDEKKAETVEQRKVEREKDTTVLRAQAASGGGDSPLGVKVVAVQERKKKLQCT